MADEALRVIARVEGEDNLKRLQTALAQDEAEVRKLHTALQALQQGSAAFQQTTEQMRLAAQRVADGTRAIQAQQQQLAGLRQGWTSAVGGLQSFTYLMDDLQYVGEQGLRPVINNLMMFSPPLALAGIMVTQLINHWKELEALWKTTNISNVQRTIDAIVKDMKGSMLEVASAAREARIQAGAKSIMEGATPAERGQEDLVSKVLGGVSEREIVNRMVEAQSPGGQVPLTKEEQTRLNTVEGIAGSVERSRRKEGVLAQTITGALAYAQNIPRGYLTTGPTGVAARERQEITAGAQKRLEAESAQLLARARTDPEALKQVTELLGRAPGTSPALTARLQKAAQGVDVEQEYRQSVSQATRVSEVGLSPGRTEAGIEQRYLRLMEASEKLNKVLGEQVELANQGVISQAQLRDRTRELQEEEKKLRDQRIGLAEQMRQAQMGREEREREQFRRSPEFRQKEATDEAGVAKDTFRAKSRDLLKASIAYQKALAGPGASGRFARQMLGRQQKQMEGQMEIQELLEDEFFGEGNDQKTVQSRLAKLPKHLQQQFNIARNQFQQAQRMGAAPTREMMQAEREYLRASNAQQNAGDKMLEAAEVIKSIPDRINLTMF